MGTEQIFKLQPDRTLYLRGFTGVGSAASLHSARQDGFSVCGVFRDMADFCVLNLYDADNVFEHYSVRYLPDFDLGGLVLTFDVAYRGLQPLDSAKYSWIDWSMLDVIREDGSTAQIRLWEHAALAGGNYSVASGDCQFTTAATGCAPGDSLTLVVNNVNFTFTASGGESAAGVAAYFASAINGFDWSTFDSHSVSVLAEADGSGRLKLKNARTGHVFVAGNNVQWIDGTPFPGIPSGSTIYIGGTAFTVAAVNSPQSLSLTSGAPGFYSSHYLAEYGGLDGNEVTAYFIRRTDNASLTVDSDTVQLLGGNSDDVRWRVTLDFTALGIDKVRQAWLTFAPQLANGRVYQDTEWTAVFSNWSVTDPRSIRGFRCAGPASVRVDSEDGTRCRYIGQGWTLLAANNLQQGFARGTATPGDSVEITYRQTQTHDLYLGASLCPNRGNISVSVDGGLSVEMNLALPVTSDLVTRRLITAGLPPGEHIVRITAITPTPQAWNSAFTPYTFVFDYVDAAVASDFPDACVTYENVSPALDWDTDATYKVSPQRLLWHLLKLGFRGQLNEYLGVFWWNQRKRGGDYRWNAATLTFADGWQAGDVAVLRIGAVDDPDPARRKLGFVLRKTVTAFDTADTIASHFLYYLNCASVSMWAEKIGTGVIRIHTRTPNWGDTLDAMNDGRIFISGNVDVGVDGTWVIDTSASNPVNFPFRAWHADFFGEIKQAGLQVTAGFSMELVNPPDDGQPGNEWYARYANGQAVITDTGFSNLSSAHCAPSPNLTQYQISAYKVIAGLQSAAGLTPWLQFGEFLWWFFSSLSQPVGYCAHTDPISIGLAQPHGMQTGDHVVISGVSGCTAANGTWSVTVTDATHFTIPASANGEWKAGTGLVRGGSMAFYDAPTKAAAQAQLGRPLAHFTCQDDDPSVNDSADVRFLASRLKAHVDAIRQAVLAAYPDARFELLYPNDVNNAVCYKGEHVPYPQGGRLNAAVNLPAEWMSKEASGFDRFKVEALSWGAQYTNLTLSTEAIQFAAQHPMSWNREDMAYLVPWFNGVCAWPAEYHLAKEFVPLVNFWAYDHLSLMSWPLPFPTHQRRSTFMG